MAPASGKGAQPVRALRPQIATAALAVKPRATKPLPCAHHITSRQPVAAHCYAGSTPDARPDSASQAAVAPPPHSPAEAAPGRQRQHHQQQHATPAAAVSDQEAREERVRRAMEEMQFMQYSWRLDMGLVERVEEVYVRLALEDAAGELGVDRAELEARLQLLQQVTQIPAHKFRRMPSSTLAALVRNVRGCASAMIMMKLLCPKADVARMVSNRPSLMLEFEANRGALERLVEFFPSHDIGVLLHSLPHVPPAQMVAILEQANPNLQPGGTLDMADSMWVLRTGARDRGTWFSTTALPGGGGGPPAAGGKAASG